jgi:cytosine/adenosine deaminase-related metal-dependent hydrolase
MRTAGGGPTAENVIFAASAADVTDVIVDGRTVVTERRHVACPDIGDALAQSMERIR